MSYIKKLKDDKSQIIKDEAFCTLYESDGPNSNPLFNKLFKVWDSRIKAIDPEVTRNALSNAHGDWYEWLIAIEAWNNFFATDLSDLAILLPNVSQFNVSDLYSKELAGLTNDLRDKLNENSDVQLISSNPDFVIINGSLARKILKANQPISEITVPAIRELQGVYKKFLHACEFHNIVGYISVKFSLRPDRRLQLSHEGSLMKALYVHLQTRQWILNPIGLKYYAMSGKVGPRDRSALKTVATHSITTVNSLPQAAVDEVFEVNSQEQALEALKQIL